MSIAQVTTHLGWLAPLAVTVHGGIWAYLALFALVLVGGAGVPMIGTLAVGTAAVLASQHELSIDDVAVVACVAAAVGGVLGYWIGNRWGLSLLERPGRYEEKRRAALAKGHQIYGRWGWLACFMIPAYMAGIASMTFVMFLIFNSLAAIIYELATAVPTYGAGRVGSGHTDAPSVIGLVVGVGLLVLLGVVLIRRRRRTRAARSLGGVHRPVSANQLAARGPADRPARYRQSGAPGWRLRASRRSAWLTLKTVREISVQRSSDPWQRVAHSSRSLASSSCRPAARARGDAALDSSARFRWSPASACMAAVLVPGRLLRADTEEVWRYVNFLRRRRT